MVEKAENHTLRLLQDMREDTRQFRDEVRERFASIETHMTEGFRSVNERLDRLESVFAGLSFLHADERGEIEAIRTRLDRVEDKLDL